MKRLMAALTAVLLTFMFLPAQRVVAAQEEFPSGISFSGVKTKIEEAVKECPEAAFTAAVSKPEEMSEGISITAGAGVTRGTDGLYGKYCPMSTPGSVSMYSRMSDGEISPLPEPDF